MHSDTFSQAAAAAEFISGHTDLRPRLAIVLGSGLGAFADDLTTSHRIPYADIPGFPHSTAEGHAGQLVLGKLGEVPIAAMQGRVHFYEGHSLQEVTFPMRVLGALGVKGAILTNAAGGISPRLEPGCLVVLSDHINMMGANPCAGPNDERFGQRFFDMSAAYDPAWRALTLAEGKRLGIKVHEGVYAAVTGPSYETPAEIRALRTLGADVVGMSTVPEVIVARHMGMRCAAISCVTNLAAGISPHPLDHKEVLEVGRRVRADFTALLRAIIPQFAAHLA